MQRKAKSPDEISSSRDGVERLETGKRRGRLRSRSGVWQDEEEMMHSGRRNVDPQDLLLSDS